MLYGMSTISLGDISNSGVFGNAVLASKGKGDSIRLFCWENVKFNINSL